MNDYSKKCNLKIHDVRVQKGDSAFLIDDGKTSILYDTGFGFTGFRIAENIKAILGDRPLNYIFLTHSHYDHALASAYILRYYPDATVVAGSYAADIFKRDGAKRVMKELDNAFAATCGVTDYEFLGDELRVDIPCEDGDIIKAGDMTFQAINLPGHTKCSVAYYCADKKLLLSSETLGVYDGGYTDSSVMPSYLIGYQITLDSIEKASKLDIKYLLSPHLGILDEKQTEFFLSHMREAAVNTSETIIDEIKRGLTDEEIISNYKAKFWNGYNREIYPEDAINLNTSITIKLLKREILGES